MPPESASFSCAICDNPLATEKPPCKGANDVYSITCKLCGTYEIANTLAMEMKSLYLVKENDWLKLAHFSRTVNIFGAEQYIDKEDVKKRLEERLPSIAQQQFALLRYLVAKGTPGSLLSLDMTYNFPILGSLNKIGADFIVDSLVDDGHIQRVLVDKAPTLRLTVKGWSAYEETAEEWELAALG